MERQAEFVAQARARLLDDLAYDGDQALWNVSARLNLKAADWRPDERTDRARDVVFGLMQQGLVELRYLGPQPAGAPVTEADLARLRSDDRPWHAPDRHDHLSVVVREADQPRLAAAAEARLARRRRLLAVELRLATAVGLLFAVVAYVIQREVTWSVRLFILPLLMCTPAVWRYRRDYARFDRARNRRKLQQG